MLLPHLIIDTELLLRPDQNDSTFPRLQRVFLLLVGTADQKLSLAIQAAFRKRLRFVREIAVYQSGRDI